MEIAEGREGWGLPRGGRDGDCRGEGGMEIAEDVTNNNLYCPLVYIQTVICPPSHTLPLPSPLHSPSPSHPPFIHPPSSPPPFTHPPPSPLLLILCTQGYGFCPVYQGEDKEFTCTGLRRMTGYTFRLSASNEKGTGPHSTTYTYHTLPDPPSQCYMYSVCISIGGHLLNKSATQTSHSHTLPPHSLTSSQALPRLLT